MPKCKLCGDYIPEGCLVLHALDKHSDRPEIRELKKKLKQIAESFMKK